MSLPDPTICHKCRERPGERHAYYYGWLRSPWRSVAPMYDIAGESEVWLCARCTLGWLWFGRAALATMAALLVLGSGSVLLLHATYQDLIARHPHLTSRGDLVPPWEVLYGLVGALAGGMLIVALVAPVTRSRAAWLAVRFHLRTHLAHRGFNAVLRPVQHDRLARQGRIRRVPQGL